MATRPAPAPGLVRPGSSPNRPSTLPGQITGGPGASTRPGFPKPGLPSGPGATTQRPGLGNVSRPTTLPGNVGGSRPGLNGNRPTTLPGNLAGTRPGSGANRPGIGGDRPAIGDGNKWLNSGNIGSGNIGSGNNNNFNNVNVGGGWGYPGYGGGHGGNWANNWNSGYVNPHYGGWYNGCWNGNWGGGYNGGWWGPFALGAATWGLASTIGSWGLGYGSFGYGAMGYPGGAYVNPYYSGMNSAVVATSPYDYSQPVVVSNYVTNDGDLTNSTDATGGTATADATPENSAANRLFDEALAKFKAGDYAAALSGCDKAVKLSPKDSVIHEVRALALFALGRYPESAATLNAVLATAPGMDWTTLSGLYDSVDTYTTQLRKLEDFCRANPESAAGHFVLAYHYLVGGYADMATEALKVVVAKQPGDAVAKRLLDAITPPKEEAAPASGTPAEGTSAPAAAAAGPETDLVGSWKATSGKDAVVLTITEDSKFVWKALPNGKPPVELSGSIATARDAIALESETAGTMTGQVVSKGPDAFDFALAGAPADAKPIAFQRQK
jgi:tetratricopeptide (TPR) repeat protein